MDDDVSVCDSSDWFSNNVYAEVDVNANDDDRSSIANNNNKINPTNSSGQPVATATLALPDDGIDDVDDAVELVAADKVHSTSLSVRDDTIENVYECGTNACAEIKIDVDDVNGAESKESPSIDTLSKTNKFFTNLSKSLRSKLKQKSAPVAELFDAAMAVPSEAGMCQVAGEIESDGGKSTLAVRLREKLRKLNFVKSRPNSDDEVSSILHVTRGMSNCTDAHMRWNA